MTSIPNAPTTPMRGNGRDPKPASLGSFHHRPRHREPLSPGVSPWDAIVYVGRIRELLDSYFTPWGVNYSIELDHEYQSLRSKLLSLMQAPCFAQMWSPDHILLPSLGGWASWDAFFWSNNAGGRSAFITLQSDLLASLIDTGIPRPATGEPAQAEPLMLEFNAGDGESTPLALAARSDQLDQKEKPAARNANKRTIDKEIRRQKVREMVAQGHTREAIARTLNVNVRTIYLDLSESNAEPNLG